MSVTGTELRRARLEEVYDELKSKGLVRNRVDFAAKLGVTGGQLSSRLKGVVDIDEAFALKVDLACGVSSDWLLAGEGQILKHRPIIKGDSDVHKLLQQMSQDIRILKEQIQELQRAVNKQ